MKFFEKILMWGVVLIALSSCTKEIDISLNNVTPAIVIEGIVTDQPGPYRVSISRTVNFGAPNQFPPVTGAVVMITDSTAAVTDTLVETSPGVYMTHTLQGKPGHTYELSVFSNGTTYTASSRMPQLVPLDSITFESNTFFGEVDINAVAHFQDPAGLSNYYCFAEWVKDEKSDWTHCFDDRLSDGRYLSISLFDDEIEVGEVVTVDMYCVDKNIYNYFFTLPQAVGSDNPGSVTPSNPLGNISNNALGYFSAQTVRSITKTVN